MSTSLLPKPILVLSDGTGETGEKMVRAALQQFKGHGSDNTKHREVHTDIKRDRRADLQFPNSGYRERSPDPSEDRLTVKQRCPKAPDDGHQQTDAEIRARVKHEQPPGRRHAT
jgi:hypothetical protein